jgi:hypothetical protein
MSRTKEGEWKGIHFRWIVFFLARQTHLAHLPVSIAAGTKENSNEWSGRKRGGRDKRSACGGRGFSNFKSAAICRSLIMFSLSPRVEGRPCRQVALLVLIQNRLDVECVFQSTKDQTLSSVPLVRFVRNAICIPRPMGGAEAAISTAQNRPIRLKFAPKIAVFQATHQREIVRTTPPSRRYATNRIRTYPTDS